MQILRRIESAWSRHSLASLLKLIVKNICYNVNELLSGRLFRTSETEMSEFDVAYGTDTDKIREIGSLNLGLKNARYAVRYQPSPHDFATEVIRALPIDFKQFEFIDFGAGKGRVLLIAAQFPFSAVIGIEFSKELCSVASYNINKFPSEKRIAGRVECHLEDVTNYTLPDSPLVCYFYNPFDLPIMQAVTEKIETSIKINPRDICITYIHPEHRELFDKKGYWNIIDEGNFHVIYRADPEKLSRLL